MKKNNILGYQTEYDAVFLTHSSYRLKWVRSLQNPYYDNDKGAFIEHHDKDVYKDYPVGSLSFMVACKIYKDGERFLASEADSEDIDFPKQDRNFNYLSELYIVGIDKNLQSKFTLKYTDKAIELVHKGYTIELEITGWYVGFAVNSFLEEIYKVSKDVWLDYFTEHFDAFNNRDNYIAQSTSFATHAIYV